MENWKGWYYMDISIASTRTQLSRKEQEVDQEADRVAGPDDLEAEGNVITGLKVRVFWKT